jgi:hypothetical protein
MPRFAPPTSGLCFRRSLLEQIFPMPELEGTSADRYLKLMALVLSKGYFLDRVLATQKVHGANAFTLRPDRQRTGAKSLVHTAYWIRQRRPQAAGLSNSLFGRGLGMYRRTGGVEPKYAGVVREYLSMASPAERAAIALRAFYHSSPLLAWARRLREA